MTYIHQELCRDGFNNEPVFDSLSDFIRNQFDQIFTSVNNGAITFKELYSLVISKHPIASESFKAADIQSAPDVIKFLEDAISFMKDLIDEKCKITAPVIPDNMVMFSYEIKIHQTPAADPTSSIEAVDKRAIYGIPELVETTIPELIDPSLSLLAEFTKIQQLMAAIQHKYSIDDNPKFVLKFIEYKSKFYDTMAMVQAIAFIYVIYTGSAIINAIITYLNSVSKR
jgi:hypothetical protein